MKINILGTKYDLMVLRERDDQMESLGADGVTDYSVKKIKVIAPTRKSPGEVEDLEAYVRKVIRHELVHAFLCESGLISADWHCEEMVDWVASQFESLLSAMKKGGGLLC